MQCTKKQPVVCVEQLGLEALQAKQFDAVGGLLEKQSGQLQVPRGFWLTSLPRTLVDESARKAKPIH